MKGKAEQCWTVLVVSLYAICIFKHVIIKGVTSHNLIYLGNENISCSSCLPPCSGSEGPETSFGHSSGFPVSFLTIRLKELLQCRLSNHTYMRKKSHIPQLADPDTAQFSVFSLQKINKWIISNLGIYQKRMILDHLVDLKSNKMMFQKQSISIWPFSSLIIKEPVFVTLPLRPIYVNDICSDCLFYIVSHSKYSLK